LICCFVVHAPILRWLEPILDSVRHEGMC
jgi:hypothetical protein